MACVVSYARPFSGQRDRFSESERDLRFEKLYRSQLSDPEDRALHNRMLKLRHKFFGHADAGAARIRFPEDPVSATLQIANALRDEDAKRLRDLAMRMSQAALSRYLELRPRFGDEEQD